MPQENHQHRQQVCHHSRRVGGQASDAAAAPMTTRSPASCGASKPHSGPRRLSLEHSFAVRRISAANTPQLGRAERRRDSVRRVFARRPPTSASRQPPRELRADRRPAHRRRPGARPREGRRPSTRISPRPPSDDSARRLPGSMPTSRGGDSHRPTLGEPTAVCRTQLDDEASRMPARLGSTTRKRHLANSGRDLRLVVPANGPHQLRGG